MSTAAPMKFGKLRSCLWPVHRSELRQFLPLFFMCLFISFNYSVLRNMKDSLLITAESSGAEVIPFIKVWGILPVALFMTWLFTRMSNRYSQETTFHLMISFFLIFFAVFAFFIYPMKDAIHPHAFADWLQTVLPSGFYGMAALVRYWSFALFYVMAECWSCIVLSVIFWGLANEVCSVGKAARFYALIGLAANASTILAGQTSYVLSCPNFLAYLPWNGLEAWEQAQNLMTVAVVVSGLLVMGICRWYCSNVLSPEDSLYHGKGAQEAEEPTLKSVKTKKKKMGLGETFRLLKESKYLLYLALIVVTYNMVINLTEVMWKDQVKQLYPNANDFNIYMSQITTLIGFVALFLAMFLTTSALMVMGWTATALITPVILLITSVGFFGFLLLPEGTWWGAIPALFGSSPLIMTVIFGSVQNCMSRGAKYTVFDATRDLAYIPLPSEMKLKGKAAIDGLGSRVGKSGGAILYQALLISLPSLASTIPYVATLLILAIVVWIISVKALGKRFNALVAEKLTKSPAAPEVTLEQGAEGKEVPAILGSGAVHALTSTAG